MPKFKLTPSPTFKAKVAIAAPGEPVDPVEFTFHYRDGGQLDELLKGSEGMSDEDLMMKICAGWDLDEEFNRSNVEVLLRNYRGCAWPVLQKYMDELNAAKQKN